MTYRLPLKILCGFIWVCIPLNALSAIMEFHAGRIGWGWACVGSVAFDLLMIWLVTMAIRKTA